MTSSSTLFESKTTTDSSPVVKAAFNLTADDILSFYQIIALEAARYKSGLEPYTRIDVSGMVASRLLKYFNAILFRKLAPARSIIAGLQTQLEILKRQGLFEQTGPQASVLAAIQEDLKNPGTVLPTFILSEQEASAGDDFIRMIEDLRICPQVFEKIGGPAQEKTAPSDNAETPAETKTIANNNELRLIEAENFFIQDLREILFSLNGKVDIENYLINLLKPKWQPRVLSKILAIKSRENFSFEAGKTSLDEPNFNSLSAFFLNELYHALCEQGQWGAALVLLGNLLSKQRAFEAAITSYKLALRYLHSIQDHRNIKAARSNLVNTLSDYAYACIEKQDFYQALNSGREALVLLCSSWSDSLEDSENLACIHNMHSLAFYNLKVYQKALQHCQAEQELRVHLSYHQEALDPKLILVKGNLLKILIMKARAHISKGEFIDAELCCQALTLSFTHLPHSTTDDNALRSLATVARACGLYFIAEENSKQAQNLFLLEIKVRQNLAEPDSTDRQESIQAKRSLMHSTLLEVEKLYVCGNPAYAIVVGRQALAEGSFSPQTREDQLNHCELLSWVGHSYYHLKCYKEAAQYFETELLHQNKISQETAATNRRVLAIALDNLKSCHFNSILQAFKQNSLGEALKISLELTKLSRPSLFVQLRDKDLAALHQDCYTGVMQALITQADNYFSEGHYKETTYLYLVTILSLKQNRPQPEPFSRSQLNSLSGKLYQALDSLIAKAEEYYLKNQLAEADKLLEKASHFLIFLKSNPGLCDTLQQGVGASQLHFAKTLHTLGRADFSEGKAQLNNGKLRAALKKFETAMDLLLQLPLFSEEVKYLLKNTQDQIKLCELYLSNAGQELQTSMSLPQCRLFHNNPPGQLVRSRSANDVRCIHP